MIRRLLTLLVALGLLAAAFLYARHAGWLTPIGIEEESSDSQIVEAIRRTQEVSLVALNIQGITERKQKVEIFGQDIPVTGETVFVKYSFTAKLGLDGSKVRANRTDADTVHISVPAFTFIGYDGLDFKQAAATGGVLKWVTPDIDRLQMANAVLSKDNQRHYVEQNEAVLKSQTKVFYDALIGGVDPDVTVTYSFN